MFLDQFLFLRFELMNEVRKEEIQLRLKIDIKDLDGLLVQVFESVHFVQ